VGVLVSKLFTDGDQAATAKLEGCATGQPSEVASHFSQGQNKTGEHVRRTQQALQNIQKNEPSLGIPPFSVSGLYDSAFARAIAVYKDRRNIRNFANKIDDVVGIKTIRRLDQDQVTIEGKGGGNTGPPAQRKGQDVYIKIFGFDNPSSKGGTSLRQQKRSLLPPRSTARPDILAAISLCRPSGSLEGLITVRCRRLRFELSS